MRQKPTIYLHCGFPKTGSTALQSGLRFSEQALKQAGFLYPYAGSLDRPGAVRQYPGYSAHQNLAWQLLRSRAFRPDFGDFAATAKEIREFSGNVILSSENFESILPDPAKFSPVFRLARETGRRLVLIVYLRSQLSYFESLFQEMLKHGTAEEYDVHATLTLRNACLETNDCHFQFDYEGALAPWKQIEGVELIIRNYHQLAGKSVIADFASLLGLEGVLQPRPGQEKVNSRNTLSGSLTLFYRNRTGREATRIETLRIRHLAAQRGKLTSSAALQRKFVDRFQASNLRLCAEWGIPATGLDMKNLPRLESEVTLEDFFSFETQCAIRSGAVPDMSFAPERAKRIGWMSGIETAGVNVPATETLRYWISRGRRYRRWYTSRLKNLLISSSAEFG